MLKAQFEDIPYLFGHPDGVKKIRHKYFATNYVFKIITLHIY